MPDYDRESITRGAAIELARHEEKILRLATDQERQARDFRQDLLDTRTDTNEKILEIHKDTNEKFTDVFGELRWQRRFMISTSATVLVGLILAVANRIALS